MASTLLTPSIIAKEGLMQLENSLVMAKKVNRVYEKEFGESKIGDTVTVRKPVKYGVRTGAVIQTQDSTEGKTQIQIAYQRGVDLRFPTKDLTLTIDDFSKRYMTHPFIGLANQVDLDVMALGLNVWNWTGTPGTTFNGFQSVGRPMQRLQEMSVPQDITGVISPQDLWGMLGSFTSLYVTDVAKTALEKAKLPMVGGAELYSSQNVLNFTTGTMTGTPVIAVGGGGSTTYAATKDTNQSTVQISGSTASTTLNAGDVITFAGCFAINPVNKQTLPYLQQFVVQANVTLTGTADNVVVSPSIIPLAIGVAGLGVNNQYATVAAAPANGAAVVLKGSPNTAYPQNLFFHENAFALCMVPMELPEGAVKKARQSANGLSVRVICDYDIINDINVWRMDILYGLKAVYPDLACRTSG